MYASTSFVSPLLHDLVENNFHSRRLLLHSNLANPPISTNIHDSTKDSSYLGDVVMSGDPSNTPVRATNTGIKKKALKSFTTVSYSTELNLPSLDSECVICLSEFTNGDKVRLLPKCNHGFHVRCIDKWLSSHSSCPKCRQCLIETCKKIVGSQGSSSQPQPMLFPAPETIVTIAPLEPEGLVRNYREVS
ncbi:hypothetical protein TSUD_179300 [Trifolium subterraneum]|uniref:RING-type E3 ubiquitin transferase n=1 Tax=Trifolium subterraneum TaxID=3900 RepID=A0A2Z6M2Z9_TRISU|nr:hypothetical protein TSUD_179300 [Trifolium subterraneum]